MLRATQPISPPKSPKLRSGFATPAKQKIATSARRRNAPQTIPDKLIFSIRTLCQIGEILFFFDAGFVWVSVVICCVYSPCLYVRLHLWRKNLRQTHTRSSHFGGPRTLWRAVLLSLIESSIRHKDYGNCGSARTPLPLKYIHRKMNDLDNISTALPLTRKAQFENT